MKNLTFALLVLSVFSSCNKENTNDESFIEISSSLGCVDEFSSQINNLPYLTRPWALKQSIIFNNSFEDYDIAFYDSEKSGIYPNFIGENQFLGIINKDGEIKFYELLRQAIKDEIIVNDDEVYVENYVFCNNKHKSTPLTVYFNAMQDSTYIISAWSGDSAYGTGIITVKDSVRGLYINNMGAGTNTGSGYFPNLYSIQSRVTGKIFIEIYIIDSTLDGYPWQTAVEISVTK